MHESFVRFATEDDALATGAAKGPRIGADGAELLVRHEVRLEVLERGREASLRNGGFLHIRGPCPNLRSDVPVVQARIEVHLPQGFCFHLQRLPSRDLDDH